MDIALPTEVDVSGGVVADDGTVVVEDDGNDVHAAVQALDDGSVRLQTVLESPDAPSTYTYTFSDDMELVLLDDGSVEVTETITDGMTTVVGLIDAPWAIDAEGTVVPTHYTVDGTSLTQHVAHSGDFAYPITADPTVSIGWGIYVKYSKTDVRRFTDGVGGAVNDKAHFAFIVCAKIPHSVAKAACGAIGVSYYRSIYDTFKEVRRLGRCVELRLAGPIPVAWKTYRC